MDANIDRVVLTYEGQLSQIDVRQLLSFGGRDEIEVIVRLSGVVKASQVDNVRLSRYHRLKLIVEATDE